MGYMLFCKMIKNEVYRNSLSQYMKVGGPEPRVVKTVPWSIWISFVPKMEKTFGNKLADISTVPTTLMKIP